MIDTQGLAKMLMGTWGQTKQPLKERGTVLPIGEYEDGSVGPAWPALLAAPAEAMVNFGRLGYDSPEALADNARSAFDIAGAAMTGGLATGLAGGMVDNAVGSAGGRVAIQAMEKAGVKPRNVLSIGRVNPDTLAISPESSLNSTWKNTVEAGNRLGTDETYMPAILNEAGDFPLDAYDTGALSDAWRKKIRTTGELFANAKPGAAVPLAMQLAEQQAADLPMDLASRMQRAKEMGFDLPAYHATGADFTDFNPGYRKASFFADTPDAAERGASGGSADWYGARDSADRIMPVMLRSQYIKGLNLTPDEKAWWQSLPETTSDEAFIEGLKYPSYKLKHWWQAYDETENPDGTFTYTKKTLPSKTLEEVRQTKTDVYGDKYIGSYEGEQGAARLAREAGMDGFILADEAGVSIGIADPRRIRSVNAAFDPAFSDSANLLAANAPTGASIPLGLEAQQETDLDPALMEVLRQYGLMPN